MCFYADYDWWASVVEEANLLATEALKCAECQAAISTGERYHHIFMQEHEECHRCVDDNCDCGAPKTKYGDCEECRCTEPDLGETFLYDRCSSCDRFLAAVEAVEQEEGCSLTESRPPLGAMCEYIHEGGRVAAKKYFQFAAKDCPELVQSGYLGKLWRRMF